MVSNKDSNENIKLIDVTRDAMKIFSCIKRVGERQNSKNVCDILRGIESEYVKEMGFDELSTFGIMRDSSKKYILHLISEFCDKGYIYCKDNYKRLCLDKSAYNVLFNEEKIFLRLNSSMFYSNFDKILFDELKTFINNFPCSDDEMCEIKDYMLKMICIEYPLNKESLRKIYGFSEEFIQKYGAELINYIFQYIKNNDVDIHKYHDIVFGEKDKNNTDSFIVSCDLYNDGMKIDDIAAVRKFTKSTICNHLLNGYKIGIVKDISKDIHWEYEELIEDAIEEFRGMGLKVIKESLPSEVTYFDIKFFIMRDEKNKDTI